jgi:hypothetical protein
VRRKLPGKLKVKDTLETNSTAAHLIDFSIVNLQARKCLPSFSVTAEQCNVNFFSLSFVQVIKDAQRDKNIAVYLIYNGVLS